jgi:N-[(2S)-2-amino-2-carboxyethyl]-L-glutamate dehydrogenase
MYMSKSTPVFSVVSGAQVHQVLRGREKQIVELVERSYRIHGAGHTVNPPSYFLRFPDRPDSRIIALPASIGAEGAVDGMKWISSFPANVASGLPRASAVLLLNDPETGYPYACLESSIISATRTAASAALAAEALSRNRERPAKVGFFGTGLIARYIHTFLAGTGWAFDEVSVFDTVTEHAAGFSAYLHGAGESKVVVRETAEDLIRSCDLVVFATVAGVPHVSEPAWFVHAPLVLHVSLRDLSPEVILASANVVDDVEHCFKANTSVHLTEQRVGHREFLTGTLPEVLTGAVEPEPDRPLVFSPFGLGVLDLAVGKAVYDELAAANELNQIDDFFFELQRYGRG